MCTSFSTWPGRWFEGDHVGEIVIEWKTPQHLVQHALKVTRCVEGQCALKVTRRVEGIEWKTPNSLVAEFCVLQCQRCVFSSHHQSDEKDKRNWKLDQKRARYATVGWRRESCTG